jgi:hypothetical protein
VNCAIGLPHPYNMLLLLTTMMMMMSLLLILIMLPNDVDVD